MSALTLRVPHRFGVARVLATARRRVAGTVGTAAAWLRARTPEQVLWVVLGLVMLAYLMVLWTASTATGRGGR